MPPVARSQRSRFTPDDFARAAAAGEPRAWMSFQGDTRSWQAYQHGWLRTFAPSTTLAPEGDSRRRPQWTAVVRQWKAIDAAREKEVSRYVEVGAAASAASSTAASADAASAELANGAGRSLYSLCV